MRPYLCISYAKDQLEMDEWSECKPTPIKLLKEFIESLQPWIRHNFLERNKKHNKFLSLLGNNSKLNFTKINNFCPSNNPTIRSQLNKEMGKIFGCFPQEMSIQMENKHLKHVQHN